MKQARIALALVIIIGVLAFLLSWPTRFPPKQIDDLDNTTIPATTILRSISTPLTSPGENDEIQDQRAMFALK